MRVIRVNQQTVLVKDEDDDDDDGYTVPVCEHGTHLQSNGYS